MDQVKYNKTFYMLLFSTKTGTEIRRDLIIFLRRNFNQLAFFSKMVENNPDVVDSHFHLLISIHLSMT